MLRRVPRQVPDIRGRRRRDRQRRDTSSRSAVGIFLRRSADYRNGIRWYQFDPSKYLIWLLSKFGLASDLKRTDPLMIKKRLLVPVVAQSWITGEEFHLIWSDKTELSQSAQQVRDWIIEESKAAAMVRLP